MTSLPNPNWKLKNIQSSKSNLEDIGYLNSWIKNISLWKNYENIEWNDPYFNNKELYFDKDPWHYYINKYCYRGDNWTFKKVPAFFGCSFTFGIGVKTPFPMLIQNRYDNDTIIPNIGIPGGSAIAIIKSFVAFANIHPMSHAFISLPQIDRFHYSARCDDTWVFDQIIPNSLDKKTMKDIFGTDDYSKLKENLVAEDGPPPFIGYKIESSGEIFAIADIVIREDGRGYGGQFKFEMQLNQKSFAKRLEQAQKSVYGE